MDRGVWQATVHGVPKSWARLNDKHNEENSRTVAKIRKLKTPPPQTEGFEEITRQAKIPGPRFGRGKPSEVSSALGTAFP